jgi:WD40 repeat protein
MILLLFLPVLSAFYSQQDTYILKREIFRTPLTSINISPDGVFLLAGFHDGSFRLMDPESFAVILEVKEAHFRAVNAMDMPPGMEYILTAGHSSIKLWDKTGKHLADWSFHATTIWNADISNDGKYVVSSAFNKTFLLWDAVSGELLEEMRGHDDVTLAVCISPDSRLIASGSSDRTVKIWDIETRRVIKTLHGPAEDIYDVAFSPDNLLLAVASKDGKIRIYHLPGEKIVHLLGGHRDMVMEVAFSPDGKYMVSASADHSLILWDVTSGERIHSFPDNEEAVLDVVFHPDGRSFYSISFAGDLTRWEMHPEIFVLRYFKQPYLEELSADPVFDPRRKGESRKDYQSRLERAASEKEKIINRYYRRYLSGNK